jgi:hypothetical protein
VGSSHLFGKRPVKYEQRIGFGRPRAALPVKKPSVTFQKRHCPAQYRKNGKPANTSPMQNQAIVRTTYCLRPKNLLTVKPAPKTTAARLPPTTAARRATLSICMRLRLLQRSTKPSVSLVRGNLRPSGTGTSRKSHSGFQPSPILYSSRFSAGTMERISS